MERRGSEWQRDRAQQEVVLRLLQAFDEHTRSVQAAIFHYASQDEDLKARFWREVPLYFMEEEQLSREEAEVRLRTLFEQFGQIPTRLTWAYVAAHQQIAIAYMEPLPVELRQHLGCVLQVLSRIVRCEEPLPDGLDLEVVQRFLHRARIDLPPFFSQDVLRNALLLQQQRAV